MAIETIQPQYNENIGGGLYIKVAQTDWVDSSVYPEIINNNYEDDITLLSPHTWKRFDFVEESIEFSDDDVDGVGFVKRLVAVVAKDTLDLLQNIELINKKRCIVIYYDANGNARVIGHIDAPAKIYFPELAHGKTRSDLNGYSVEITAAHRERAPYYQGTAPVAEYVEFTGIRDSIISGNTTTLIDDFL